MRKTLLVPMAAAMLVTGCSGTIDLGMGDWSGFGGIGPCCAPGIQMTPSTTHLLKGDTIRLSTLFFQPGADSTTWSIGDSAFRVVRVSPVPRDTVVLQASRRGSALVMASRAGSTASLLLNAHDSSDVTAVRIDYPLSGATFRLTLAEYGTAARLMVGSGLLGSHRPTWSTSDTTKAVIAMRAGPSFDPAPRASILPRGAGQVYVIASWRTLRDSVSVTITP